MAEVNDENTLITNYDRSKTFIGGNRYIQESITATADLAVGTVIDRVTATGALAGAAFNSATDANNKIPVGVLAQAVKSGETKTVNICVEGDVAAGKLVFGGTDTLETVISGRKVKDLLQDLGVRPITVTELSSYDNYS